MGDVESNMSKQAKQQKTLDDQIKVMTEQIQTMSKTLEGTLGKLAQSLGDFRDDHTKVHLIKKLSIYFDSIWVTDAARQKDVLGKTSCLKTLEIFKIKSEKILCFSAESIAKQIQILKG